MKIKSILVILLIIFGTQSFSQELITMFKKGRYWGVIDVNGTEIVKPKYFLGGEFNSGFAKIATYKFINRKGEVFNVKSYVKKNLTQVLEFNDGMLAVKIGGKWGFINTKGELIIEPKYTAITNFNRGYSLVRNKKTYYTINKSGIETEVITQRKITAISQFSNGICAIMVGSKVNNVWGYINEEGKTIIEPQYISVGNFNNGVAWVLKDGEGVGFIDKKGNWVVKPMFNKGGDLDSIGGMARIKDKEGWGYTNMKGEVIHPENIEVYREFSEGLCMFRRKNKWGFIDNSGVVVIEPIFDSKAYSKISKLEPLQYNSNARVLFSTPDNEGVKPFKNGYSCVKFKKKWGVINKKGKWVIQPIYDDIFSFSKVIQ